MESMELGQIFALFFDELPVSYDIKNTSHGEDDFREAIIAEWKSGEKYVLKLSENDFTVPERIIVWKQCAEEYRMLGYYCPAILSSQKGDFPRVRYKGHNCVAYVEEFCKYLPANEWCGEENTALNTIWADAAWRMTAEVAAKHFDFTQYPSGYCLFETFCATDEVDEVLQNAQEWKRYADTLPDKFRIQIRRIWKRWTENRRELELLYHKLPTSVFQADLNPTNLLVDENGQLVGVFDFNLCGRDVFLNYLFREIHWQFDEAYLLDTLKELASIYCFSEEEKQAAPLLYRCIKPLWYTEIERLKKAGADENRIKECLDATEELQTKELHFERFM